MTRRLRIAHVVSSIANKDAGPSYSVPRLSEELARHHDVTLHTLEPEPEDPTRVSTVYYKRLRILNSLGISPTMGQGLRFTAPNIDVMHFHGMWMMPNVYPAWATRDHNLPLVMSPRGMMETWARRRSTYRKAIFGRLLQFPALSHVDCFHATSRSEAQSIREAGYTAPIAIVPIGIDIPHELPPPDVEQRTVLYLGRLHPKKNIDGLLRAWSAVFQEQPDWSLTIAGSGDPGYVGALRAMAGTDSRVTFRGPAYSVEKAELYRSAELFVLPTHSENFGIVVAEALSHGTPVIATTGSPWEGLAAHNCGWWIDNSDESLASTLAHAMGQSSANLRSLGTAGRAWVTRDFSWQAIADQTIATYRWLLGEVAAPAVVAQD